MSHIGSMTATPDAARNQTLPADSSCGERDADVALTGGDEHEFGAAADDAALRQQSALRPLPDANQVAARVVVDEHARERAVTVLEQAEVLCRDCAA